MKKKKFCTEIIFLVLNFYLFIQIKSFTDESKELQISESLNITHSEKLLNVEYDNLNNLVFKKNSLMIWQGPSFDKNNTVFFINVNKTMNGRIINKDDNGLIIWFINNSNKANNEKLNILVEDDENIFGVNKDFEGIGIKINEMSIISVLNINNNSVEKSYFSEISRKIDLKIKKFQCDIPSSNTLNLRITFYNNYVYVEYLKDGNQSINNYEFCFLSKYTNKNNTFLITAGLENEKTIFTFDNLSMANILNLKHLDNMNNMETTKLNTILESKLEIIDKLTKETYINTQNMKSKFENLFNIEGYTKYINSLEKTKFDFEILEDVLKDNFLPLSINNTSYNNNLNKSQIDKELFDLISIISNLTFDKISFNNKDPRETLINSIDDLRVRQNSMNGSIIEMYESTLSALEEIKQKAVKMEVYNIFQQVLFVLIFINAAILFCMYKNIQERELRESNIKSKDNLRLAV